MVGSVRCVLLGSSSPESVSAIKFSTILASPEVAYQTKMPEHMTVVLHNSSFIQLICIQPKSHRAVNLIKERQEVTSGKIQIASLKSQQRICDKEAED